MMIVEMMSIHQIKPFSANGIHHRMRFAIQSDHRAAADFTGEMGLKVLGGQEARNMVNGVHVFALMDTERPYANGTIHNFVPYSGYERGRRLALPGKHVPGNLGTCRRHCINCDDVDPQNLIAGWSTGTICTANIKLDPNSKFVYRLVQRGYTQVEYDAAKYFGVEWEVRIAEQSTGAAYTLGSIVTEGTWNKSGITDFFTVHEHLGCAPCDAYYQSVRTTGPFILNPRGAHSLMKATETSPLRTQDQDCDMKRVFGLGGSTILYESGPGVKEASRLGDRVIFDCPISTSGPEGNLTTSIAPC
jgi:hypothetical protein